MNLETLWYQIQDMVAINPWLITLAIIVGGVILISFLLIRKARMTKRDGPPIAKKSKKPRYEFRLCIIGDKHRWIKTIQNSMVFTFTDPNPPIPKTALGALYDGRKPNSYDIDPTVLYELDPTLVQKLKMFLKKIDTMFLVVFNEGKNEPVKYQPPKRSAYVLKTIEESQALSTAFKREFAGEFSVKKMFMYLIIVIVAVVAYMIMTGQLKV